MSFGIASLHPWSIRVAQAPVRSPWPSGLPKGCAGSLAVEREHLLAKGPGAPSAQAGQKPSCG